MRGHSVEDTRQAALRVTDLLPALISRVTGATVRGPSPMGDDDPVRRVVLMVLDGFGWDQMERALDDGLMPNLQGLMEEGRAAAKALDTVFPSMTPVVLTSILTGRYPSEHGIVGQVVRLPSGPVDILHEPWPEAEAPALSGTDLAEELRAAGLVYRVLLEHRLLLGPLTDILHARAATADSMTTFVAASGLPVLLEDLLDQSEAGAIYTYWSAIDAINHRRGAFNREWAAEVEAIDQWIGRLGRTGRPGTRIWITADHGHVKLQHPLAYQDLQHALAFLPERPAEVGNGIGITVDAHELDLVTSAVDRLYPGRVEVLDVDDLFDRGMFGPPGPRHFRARVGSHLLWASRVGDHWWMDPKKTANHSSHGGLSRAEMEVPWIEIRLD